MEDLTQRYHILMLERYEEQFCLLTLWMSHLKHGLMHLIYLIYVSWKFKNGRCRFRPTEVGANCQGIVRVPAGDELSLQKAVASIGPIVVSLDASKTSFKQYRNGVYDDKACSKKLITHYALIVGYGEFQNKKYWLIKNR